MDCCIDTNSAEEGQYMENQGLEKRVLEMIDTRYK